MKRWLVLLLFVASPAFAQGSLLGDLQAARQKYPTPMSKEQVGRLLNEVAWAHVNDGWRLLKKPAGNNCPSPSGDLISCDYLVWMGNGQGFDVLRDQEGAGEPVWQTGDVFSPDRFSLPVASGLSTPPPPIVNTPPVNVPPIINIPPAQILDLSSVLAAIKDVRDAQERIYADETNQRKDQTTAIVAAVNSPGWFQVVFGNRYVQMAIAGVGTWLTTMQMTK